LVCFIKKVVLFSDASRKTDIFKSSLLKKKEKKKKIERKTERKEDIEQIKRANTNKQMKR